VEAQAESIRAKIMLKMKTLLMRLQKWQLDYGSDSDTFTDRLKVLTNRRAWTARTETTTAPVGKPTSRTIEIASEFVVRAPAPVLKKHFQWQAGQLMHAQHLGAEPRAAEEWTESITRKRITQAKSAYCNAFVVALVRDRVAGIEAEGLADCHDPPSMCPLASRSSITSRFPGCPTNGP
jgi:hypothetical protein